MLATKVKCSVKIKRSWAEQLCFDAVSAAEEEEHDTTLIHGREQSLYKERLIEARKE